MSVGFEHTYTMDDGWVEGMAFGSCRQYTYLSRLLIFSMEVWKGKSKGRCRWQGVQFFMYTSVSTRPKIQLVSLPFLSISYLLLVC